MKTLPRWCKFYPVFLCLSGFSELPDITTSAEKMDLCDSLNKNKEMDGFTCDEVCHVEVGPRMEQHLIRSIKNSERLQLFKLLKVGAIKAASLYSVMISKCLKSTKTNDKALICDQALLWMWSSFYSWCDQTLHWNLRNLIRRRLKLWLRKQVAALKRE